MQWRRIADVLVLAVSVGACAEPSGHTGDGVGISRARLVGGTPDASADPAIGVLEVTTDAGGQCTAELIAKNVLLTAAHCVSDEQGKFLGDKVQYRFATKPNYDDIADGEWVEIQPKDVHPSPDFDNDSSEHDIAVLVLDKGLDVTPLPLNTKPLGTDVAGQTVRLVGYGATHVTASETEDDGFGLKRSLTTTVAKVEATVALVGRTGAQACGGDSGGPALLSIDGVETLIAIDNYSDARVDCTEGEYYRRVDTELSFIQPFLATASLAAAAGSDGTLGGTGGDANDPSQGSDAKRSKPSSSANVAANAGSCSIGVGGRGSAGTDATLPWALALAFALFLARTNAVHLRRREP